MDIGALPTKMQITANRTEIVPALHYVGNLIGHDLSGMDKFLSGVKAISFEWEGVIPSTSDKINLSLTVK